MATASEIADAAQTSNATVVRAVQTLGYAGLPELRKEIGERMAGRYDRRTRWDDRFAKVSDDPKSVLDSLLHDATDLLGEMRSADHDEFLASVKLVTHASSITFFGWGAGGTMAEYAALGLVRIGCPRRLLSSLGTSWRMPFPGSSREVLSSYWRLCFT